MQKQTVIFEENPKWRIYKGKIFVKLDNRARILYLIILWFQREQPRGTGDLTNQHARNAPRDY